MAPIRSKPSHRILFLILSSGLLLLVLATIKTDERQEWKAIQRDYRKAYSQRLREKVETAEASGNEGDLMKWRKLYQEVRSDEEVTIRQIFLPDAGVRDLCGTCHLGMENSLFRDAELPLRSHPAEMLHHHPPNRFGCTLCHHGQGTALTSAKAHGHEANWPRPRVPLNLIQGLCYGCHDSAFGLAGAEKAAYGETLFVEHGCYGCHATPAAENLPPMSTALDGIGLKIRTPAWLFSWITEPSAIRRRTLMPGFRLTEDTVRHIVAYLTTLRTIDPAVNTGGKPAGNRDLGRTLFTDKGCIACHSVLPDQGSLADRVPNLADAGLKLDSGWTAAWLRNPGALISRTAMPKMMLTEADIGHLCLYLDGLREQQVAQRLGGVLPEQLSGGDAAEGRSAVQTYGCYGCHPIESLSKLPKAGLDVAEVAHKRLEELPFGNDTTVPRTKWDWLLSKIRQPDLFATEDMPLKMPDYVRKSVFGDAEIEALGIFYLHQDAYDLPAGYLSATRPEMRIRRQGTWLLGHYNCAGCHQLAEDQAPRISEHLALKSMIPPRLLGEGERVQPQWLFQFLSRPTEMRPWLKMRMPEFAFRYADKTELIEHFVLQAPPSESIQPRAPYVLLPVRTDYEAETIQMGEYRVLSDKCMQCHPVALDGTLPPDVKVEDLSINLMLSKSRLRFDWIKNFLRDPDVYAGRGTKMPYVYYTPDKVPRIPDPEMWIEYTARFLMFMDKVPEIQEDQQMEAVRPGSDVDWTSY
ncbi:MAG: c-type cytochrome [Thermodesulfobacteriota bacterium]